MIHYRKFLISIFFLVCYFIPTNSSIPETIKDNGASVFMYHRIGENKYPSTNVTVEQFDEHINYISTNYFNIVPLSDVLDIIINNQEFNEIIYYYAESDILSNAYFYSGIYTLYGLNLYWFSKILRILYKMIA